MGVRSAGFTGLFCLSGMIFSPATDDPIVLVGLVMGISGIAMLVCGGLAVADRIKQARKAKRLAERQNRK